MGASISFDTKYRLVLDTEVECISVNPPGTKAEKPSSVSDKPTKRHSESGSDDGSERGSGSDNESGNGSETGSGTDSDSDTENKIYTVKITPEIVSYIRSYLRKNEFLDEFDLITEIDLDSYDHAPGSALVFNSDSIVYITNNQTIEVVGEWEYLPPEKEEVKQKSSKSSKSSKSKSKNNRDDDDDDDDHDNSRGAYKTKDDELPVGEIENILRDKFDEYNKGHEFVIHESKNSFLCLKINSVEILKA
jgi:hypothetical protein